MSIFDINNKMDDKNDNNLFPNVKNVDCYGQLWDEGGSRESVSTKFPLVWALASI